MDGKESEAQATMKETRKFTNSGNPHKPVKNMGVIFKSDIYFAIPI